MVTLKELSSAYNKGTGGATNPFAAPTAGRAPRSLPEGAAVLVNLPGHTVSKPTKKVLRLHTAVRGFSWVAWPGPDWPWNSKLTIRGFQKWGGEIAEFSFGAISDPYTAVGLGSSGTEELELIGEVLGPVENFSSNAGDGPVVLDVDRVMNLPKVLLPSIELEYLPSEMIYILSVRIKGSNAGLPAVEYMTQKYLVDKYMHSSSSHEFEQAMHGHMSDLLVKAAGEWPVEFAYIKAIGEEFLSSYGLGKKEIQPIIDALKDQAKKHASKYQATSKPKTISGHDLKDKILQSMAEATTQAKESVLPVLKKAVDTPLASALKQEATGAANSTLAKLIEVQGVAPTVDVGTGPHTLLTQWLLAKNEVHKSQLEITSKNQNFNALAAIPIVDDYMFKTFEDMRYEVLNSHDHTAPLISGKIRMTAAVELRATEHTIYLWVLVRCTAYTMWAGCSHMPRQMAKWADLVYLLGNQVAKEMPFTGPVAADLLQSLYGCEKGSAYMPPLILKQQKGASFGVDFFRVSKTAWINQAVGMVCSADSLSEAYSGVLNAMHAGGVPKLDPFLKLTPPVKADKKLNPPVEAGKKLEVHLAMEVSEHGGVPTAWTGGYGLIVRLALKGDDLKPDPVPGSGAQPVQFSVVVDTGPTIGLMISCKGDLKSIGLKMIDYTGALEVVAETIQKQLQATVGASGVASNWTGILKDRVFGPKARKGFVVAVERAIARFITTGEHPKQNGTGWTLTRWSSDGGFTSDWWDKPNKSSKNELVAEAQNS